MSAHRKAFLLGAAAAPNFAKGSETTRHAGPLCNSTEFQPLRSPSENILSHFPRPTQTGFEEKCPSVPTYFKQARAPSPPLLGHQKSTACILHSANSTTRWAEWFGGGNVHENIEIDEQGAAFRGSGQGPWQEVQRRTWSAWLFTAPDTGTPVERQGA